MKPGKPSGTGQTGSGRGGRSRLIAALILIGLVSWACSRPAAPPPPPPQAAPPPPPPPPPMPTITISADPDTITAGESTTLQWSATNANDITIEPGIGSVAANGTRSVSPEASVTYTATATGPGGNTSDDVAVTVNQPPPPPPPPPPPGPTLEELFQTTVVPIYFDYDRSEIRANQVERLQGNLQFLQENASINFTVGGHADERGTQEYNVALADRRANAIRQYLEENGIAAARINTISYGEERPVCTDSNEECWQENRRGEFAMR